MLWILIAVGVLFLLYKIAQFRGLLFGCVLTAFILALFLLSRFHLRKSAVLLGALLMTAILLGFLSEFLKSRKK